MTTTFGSDYAPTYLARPIEDILLEQEAETQFEQWETAIHLSRIARTFAPTIREFLND